MTPATIVGHSNAAAAAIWAAAEAPDQVTGIALVGPFLLDGKLSPVLRLAEKVVTGSPLIWSRLYYPSLYKAARPDDFSDYLGAMRASLREPGRMRPCGAWPPISSGAAPVFPSFAARC